MKVIKLNTTNSFSCVPRFYPNESDTLKVELTNELTKDIINLSFTFQLLNEYLSIVLLSVPNQFKSGTKYSITIINESQNSTVIYMGKLLIVDENTNVQNYEYQKQSESIFKYE